MNKIVLGKIANIRTGKLDANASSEDGRYPFFTCSKEPLSINSYSYDCECVLVAGNGDLNVKYFNGKFDAYQRTYIIEAKDKSELSVKYLYNFIDSKMDFIRSQSIGGVIKYIKLGDLTSLKIPLPPLTTQQTISSELDLLNSLINKQKAQLTELDSLAESVFYDMFGDPVENEKGWEVKKLGEIGTLKNGLNYNKTASLYSVKLLGISDFKNNKIINTHSLSNEIFTDTPVNEEYNLRNKDIVFVRSNGSKELVGRCAIINHTNSEVVTFSGFCIRFRQTKDIVSSIYLISTLSDKGFRKHLFSNGRGCNISNINQQILSALSIPIPPLSLQQQFAATIEKIEAQKALVKQSIAQSEQLLASRMQYYFE